MNKKTLFHQCVVLALAALLFSCNQKDHIVYYVDQSVRSFFNYPVGSYWVMKDSATGQVDSFSVIGFYKDFLRYKDYDEEWMQTNIKDIPLLSPSDTNNFTLQSSWPRMLTIFFNNTDRSMRLVFQANIEPGGIDIDAPNLPVYSANGVSYANCISNDVPYLDLNSGYKNITLHIILNKTQGLIKLKTNFPNYSHVWELMRCKLNR